MVRPVAEIGPMTVIIFAWVLNTSPVSSMWGASDRHMILRSNAKSERQLVLIQTRMWGHRVKLPSLIRCRVRGVGSCPREEAW